LFDSSKVPADLEKAIENAVRLVAIEWPDMVDENDVRQQTWFYLLKDDAAIWKEIEGLKGPKLEEAVKMLASRAVSQEREQYDYFTGNFFYSTNEVRDLLKRGALIKGRERTWTERQDIDRGMEALAERYRSAVAAWEASRSKGNKMQKPLDYAAIIWANYVLDQPIHKHWKDLTRAVDALTREMNRVHFKVHNPERFRQKPSATVRIRNKFDPSVDYTRELTEAEWNKTASEYAKDLAIYNESRPYGGPGSRTIKIGMVEEIDPEKISDVTEDGTRVVEPEIVEDMD